MPGVTTDSGELNSLSIVPQSLDAPTPRVYPLRSHGLTPPIARLSISWARGNTLRVSLLQSEDAVPEHNLGGKVVEVTLGNAVGEEVTDAEWQRIARGSATPFALLQDHKDSIDRSPYDKDWWEHVIDYSKEINSLLSNSTTVATPTIENPKTVLKNVEEPTPLKAAWELMEIFYADKQCQTWIPERLLDWLADFDCLFSGTQPTVHSKLVAFQELVNIQTVENDPDYWEAISSALAVGWLDIGVKLLRLHGSYAYDQLGSREMENGLVETIALLIEQMPRMRPDLAANRLGACYRTKPEFMKAWEKWRAQITKLDCSGFWLECEHQQTREGLKNMLQIMLGNANVLSNATYHWIELFISHFLYIRPFTVGLESMYSLAQKCMHLKPMSYRHKLMGLLIGILEENTEVVIAECSRSFGPWMVTHAIELLTAGSAQAEILLHEEQSKLGGICIEELHRLIYAQMLYSHALTWEIAPLYLTACMKQGLGLLENLLYHQPVQHREVLEKSIEICRISGLDFLSHNLMKIAGVHHWKHGKKDSAVYWLQQAQDEVRLNRIAKHLFDFIGKASSDESFKQWEGIVELLGTESQTAGGLEFLKKYRDFRRSLQQVQEGITTDAAWKAVDALVSLMRSPSTPPQCWLPLLHDSLKLLNWRGRPLFNVTQTNILLNKLQELSLARLRPGFIDAGDLPPEALKSVRLALATNLGRAILEE